MVVKGIVKVIKEANDEYSAKAAEESAKREQERKERDAAEKAARAERKAKAAEEKAAKGEAAVKTAVRGKKAGALSNAVKRPLVPPRRLPSLRPRLISPPSAPPVSLLLRPPSLLRLRRLKRLPLPPLNNQRP